MIPRQKDGETSIIFLCMYVYCVLLEQLSYFNTNGLILAVKISFEVSCMEGTGYVQLFQLGLQLLSVYLHLQKQPILEMFGLF